MAAIFVVVVVGIYLYEAVLSVSWNYKSYFCSSVSQLIYFKDHKEDMYWVNKAIMSYNEITVLC